MAIFLPILIIANISRHKKIGEKGQLVIKNLSERLDQMGLSIQSSQMDAKSFKKILFGID